LTLKEKAWRWKLEYSELGEGSTDGPFEHSCELRVLKKPGNFLTGSVRTHEQTIMLARNSLCILKLRNLLQIY